MSGRDGEGYSPATPAHPATMIGRPAGQPAGDPAMASQVADMIAAALAPVDPIGPLDSTGVRRDIPQNGHRWTITMTCVGASSIKDDPDSYQDSRNVDEFKPVVIRAHSLPEALRIASKLPLGTWVGWRE